MGRNKKDLFCSICSTSDVDSFYTWHKSKCKKCILKDRHIKHLENVAKNNKIKIMDTIEIKEKLKTIENIFSELSKYPSFEQIEKTNKKCDKVSASIEHFNTQREIIANMYHTFSLGMAYFVNKVENPQLIA